MTWREIAYEVIAGLVCLGVALCGMLVLAGIVLMIQGVKVL